MTEIHETAYNQTADNPTAEICTNEHKWINKILKYATSHPDQVHILEHPDTNHGVLLAELPKSWFKVSPPRNRIMSEEQKAAAAERLRNARQKST
jgi:hypothetical protein